MPHESAPQGTKVVSAEFLRQLDEIQIGMDLPEGIQPVQTAKPHLPAMSFQAPSRDDPDIIFDEPKLTRYDRACADLRKAEAARDALLELSSRTEAQTRNLTILERQVAKAKTAMRTAQSDISRLRDNIDAYRKTPEGREKRNASLRKVRAVSNADLAKMTPEQKAQKEQHQKNMAADRKWRERQRKAGWTEEQIQAGLAARRIEREA